MVYEIIMGISKEFGADTIFRALESAKSLIKPQYYVLLRWKKAGYHGL